MREKLKGYLGLAVRAGSAYLGVSMALDHIRSGRSGVVLIDEEASENTRKKLCDAADFRHVRRHILPAGWISGACGKGEWLAVSIAKGNLADLISRLAETEETERE